MKFFRREPASGARKMMAQVRQMLRLIRLKPYDNSTLDGRSQERYRRAALSTVSSALVKAVSLISTVISVRLTVQYLGTERYGLWMAISSAIAMLGFADLGMGNGLVTAISEADGKDDQDSIRLFVSTGFFMLLGVALIGVTIFAGVYHFVSWAHLFNVTSLLSMRESGPTTAALMLCFAIGIPIGLVQSVQTGYQEGYISNLWQSAGSVLAIAGLIVAIHLRAGLPWLVVAMAGVPLLATTMNGIVEFGRSRPWLRPRPRLFNQAICRMIARSGFLFFVLQILTILGFASDNLIIARVLGAGAVASYAITQKLFTVALLGQIFLTPLWPAFGEALARRDYEWAKRTLDRALVVSMVLGGVTALPLLLFGKQIIGAWAGHNVVPTFPLLAGFAANVLIMNYTGTMSVFLSNGLLLGRQVWFFSIAALVSVLLKFTLAHRWHTPGVIWATVIGYGVFYVIPAARLAYGSLRVQAESAEDRRSAA